MTGVQRLQPGTEIVPVFMIESSIGVFALKSLTARKARAYARRKYGTVSEPIKVTKATVDLLRDHLRAGCVVFDDLGGIIEPCEAYARADLPLPAKFGGPGYHTGHSQRRGVATPLEGRGGAT